ncbi:hypothetical protein CYMTET_47895, partial [Cymbomonas tetramitiformis]
MYLANNFEYAALKAQAQSRQVLTLKNVPPAIWWLLFERIGERQEPSNHTAKLTVKEPKQGWAHHEHISAMMHAGGFEGFPYCYDRPKDEHNPIDMPDRTLIQGNIGFIFDNKQDYATLE